MKKKASEDEEDDAHLVLLLRHRFEELDALYGSAAPDAANADAIRSQPPSSSLSTASTACVSVDRRSSADSVDTTITCTGSTRMEHWSRSNPLDDLLTAASRIDAATDARRPPVDLFVAV